MEPWSHRMRGPDARRTTGCFFSSALLYFSISGGDMNKPIMAIFVAAPMLWYPGNK